MDYTEVRLLAITLGSSELRIESAKTCYPGRLRVPVESLQVWPDRSASISDCISRGDWKARFTRRLPTKLFVGRQAAGDILQPDRIAMKCIMLTLFGIVPTFPVNEESRGFALPVSAAHLCEAVFGSVLNRRKSWTE